LGNIDTGSKRIIHLYNHAWIEWALQQPLSVEEELSSDFQFIQRDSDSLLKVKGPQGSFLSLTELQFVYKSNLPERLMAYAALAREKYDLPVFVTVVYFRPPPLNEKVATCFHEEFMGQTSHQDFKVIALWELEAKKALAFNNPAMLPFVPLMQGGNTVEMLQTCAERIRQEEHAEELEMFLGLLASYALDRKLVQQILRCNMEFVENSPLFQDILAQLTEKIRHKMTEEVRQEIRDESRKEGGRQSMLNALQQILTSRFSVDSTHFDKHFQSLDLKSFEELFKIALNAQTLAEFENALNDTLSSKEVSEKSVDKN